MARAATECFDLDGAAAVIIGGGPLSGAARTLREQFGRGIVEPVPAAVRRALMVLSEA